MDKPCRWPLIVAALIAYGSLYPFGFAVPPSFGAFWDELLAQRRLWTGLGDVAGNVLLFVPLGASGVLCLGARGMTVTRAALLLVGASAFSFAVQVLQVFEPTRDPALSDVVWNTLGTVGGILAGLALESYVALLPRAAWARSRFAVMLIAAWAAAELWPFVPSLDWFAIKQTLKALVLAGNFSVPSFVFHFASVLVLGLLLVESAPTPHVGLRLATLVLGVLGGKLVLQAAPLSLSFATACLAALAAWPLFARRAGSATMLATFVALLAAYTVRSLVPLELRGIPAPFVWLPFAAMLEGSMSANLRSLLTQLFAFGVMLWLIARTGGRLPGSAAALALWVGLVELAQRWIVGRTPDITPSILVIALAVVLVRIDRGDARHRATQATRPTGVAKRDATA